MTTRSNAKSCASSSTPPVPGRSPVAANRSSAPGAATVRSAPSRSSPKATCAPAPMAFPAPEPMDHRFVLDALTSADWTEMGTIPRASNDTRLLVLARLPATLLPDVLPHARGSLQAYVEASGDDEAVPLSPVASIPADHTPIRALRPDDGRHLVPSLAVPDSLRALAFFDLLSNS